jgi:ketosteroid isomerase-like protein
MTTQGVFERRGYELRPVGATDERLRDLLDKQEIHEAMLRYCRGCDRADGDLLKSVLHPDAVFERGPDSWQGVEENVADLIERTRMATKQLHTVTNELIEINGNSARVEAYWVFYGVSAAEGREYASEYVGRYIDRWERREDGHWKIAHRVYVGEWGRVDPVDGPPNPLIIGLQTRDDISYVDTTA